MYLQPQIDFWDMNSKTCELLNFTDSDTCGDLIGKTYESVKSSIISMTESVFLKVYKTLSNQLMNTATN